MANYQLDQTGEEVQEILDAVQNKETTRPVLNSSKLITSGAVRNALAEGYLYKGVADHTTNPGTPTEKVFYIASDPGTYSNFGTGISVAEGEVAILKYDTAWHKEVTGAATAAQVTELGQKVDENCTVDAKRFIVDSEQYIPFTIANGETIIVRVVKAAGASTSVFARTDIGISSGQVQLRSLQYADEIEVTVSHNYKYLYFTGANLSNGAVVDIIRKGKLWQNVKDNMDLTRYQNPSYPCFVANSADHKDYGRMAYQIYGQSGVQGWTSWAYRTFRSLRLTGFDKTKRYCLTMLNIGYGSTYQIRFKELVDGSLSNEVIFNFNATGVVAGGINRMQATSGDYGIDALMDFSCIPENSSVNLGTVTNFIVAPECFEPTTTELNSQLTELEGRALTDDDLTISVISDNLANPQNIQVGKAILNDGGIYNRDGWAIISIPVNPGDVITFGGFILGGGVGHCAFYNGTSHLSHDYYSDNTLPKSVTIPDNCNILYIDIMCPTSPSGAYDNLMVNYGESLLPRDEYAVGLTKIKGYKLAESDTDLEERVDELETKVADIEDNIVDLIADLPVSDGSDIQVGYAYIDSATSVVKVKLS